jgi:hypothetical protein
VVEINSARLAHMPDFQELARVRGLRFSQVISTDYGPEHGASVRARRDYYVDAARVLDEVRRMESG